LTNNDNHDKLVILNMLYSSVLLSQRLQSVTLPNWYWFNYLLTNWYS